MKNEILRKILGIIVFVILIGIVIFPSSAINTKINKPSIATFNGKTLYVGGSGPGNYTSIQAAIDDSADGYTIFVYDDSSPYHESLTIEKSINLFGENKYTTIVNCSLSGDVVNIFADWINISGFSIQNSGNNGSDAGIEIHSKFNHIIDNIIMNNDGGISLVNTSNNTIYGNIIMKNDYGIRFFTNSYNNKILGNNLNQNKFRAIRLEASDSNIIMNNIISDNGNGIRLEDSYYNIISENVISDNGNGIDLYTSIGNTLLNNTFFNDGLQIYDSYQNFVENNIVNDKPLVYLESESNKILNEAGQVILVNCDNITVQNQVISDITYGIELWQTNNSLITGNTLRSNYYDGIYLYSSKNNTITGNTILNNTNGISLEYTDFNIISRNIISNSTYGIHLFVSGNNINISSNNISNNGFGIQLFYSQDITITNNKFSNNHFGVSLWNYCSNIDILDNKFMDCGSGIWLNYARNTMISKNIFSNCESSIDFYQSDNNYVKNNKFVRGGIVVTNSFNNVVDNNIINGRSLVYLEDKSDIVLEEAGQVILINCNNITVQNLDLINVIIGLELLQTDSCQISNNNFIDNYYGSGFINSNNNNFSNNNISNHRLWGIFLSTSNDNTIFNNNIHVENPNSNRIVLLKRDIGIPQSFYFNDNRKNPLINYNQMSSGEYLHLWRINDKDQVVIKNIFDESRGIELGNCIGNIIKENTIKKNQDGIILEISNFNTIDRNHINSNNRSGIKIIYSEENNIMRNTIISCRENGIFFKDSNSNKIGKNNFILNYQNALFENSFFNQWNKNYWNRPRLLPKLIFGKIEIESNWILWFNIDWRPAINPYKIGD